MSTSTSSGTATMDASRTGLPFRLEVVVIPVADVDRARAFFTETLGWRLDAAFDGANGYRLVQVTPTGSAASIIFGSGVTVAQPGTFDGLLLAVENIAAARDELLARGVQVSEIFHDAGGGLGGGFHVGEEGRAPGPDPEGRSYGSYATFSDSESNRWVLQELTERLPGRV